MLENNLCVKNSLTSEVINGLKSLIYPEICLGCNNKFVAVCDSCRAKWSLPAQRFSIGDLMISSVLIYDSASSRIILKAKEDRNMVARELMACALAKSIYAWCGKVDFENLLLVPIPSTPAAIRRRGGSFLHPILDQALDNCEEMGLPRIRWKNILTHQKRVRDQSELSFKQRVKNLENAFTVSEQALQKTELELGQTDSPGILLIDDVVTTGATLSSAAQALIERKMTVLGAASVCASAHRLLIR